MIKALAPRMRRGFSWVWLSIVWFGIVTGVALGQTGKAGAPKDSSKAATKSAPKKADTKAAAKDDKEKEADDEPAAKDDKGKDADKGGDDKPEVAEGEEKGAGVEIFRDEASTKILENKTFKAVGRSLPIQVQRENIKQLRVMGAGERSWDQEIAAQTVEALGNTLTTPSVIQGLTDMELPRAQAATKIKNFRDAVDGLSQPLINARKAKNATFIDAYNKVLLAKLPPLLKNNFYARIEAIILLSNIESVDALPVLTSVLKDKDQTLWVQLRALRGISTVAGFGARDLPARPAVDAAHAIVDFLKANETMPWPARMRAIEALGSLRLAKDPRTPSDLKFATAIMSYLADPEARPEVRATAAWAMGMLKIDGTISKFNYPLVAYFVADVAAQVGEQANRSFDKQKGVTELCTSLLLYRLHGAFEGTPEARESGLLHGAPGNSAFAQSKALLKQTDDQIAPVARASLALIRGTSGQAPKLRQELSNTLANLRQFLDKNVPENDRLVPGGTQAFPVKQAEVAEAPGRK